MKNSIDYWDKRQWKLLGLTVYITGIKHSRGAGGLPPPSQ